MDGPLALVVSGLLAAACVADVRWRIIPDWTVGGLALAGGLGAALAGATPAHLLVGLVALTLGVLAAWRGLWGWGDAKLIGACGVVAGPAGFAALLLWTALGGAALAALMLAARPAALRFGAGPARWPRWMRVELKRLRRAPSLPYALPIALGLMAALLGSGEPSS